MKKLKELDMVWRSQDHQLYSIALRNYLPYTNTTPQESLNYFSLKSQTTFNALNLPSLDKFR